MVPAYLLTGNHDKYNPTDYVKVFRHLNYGFDYGPAHHFTCIDSSIHFDSLSEDTYAFLVNDVKTHQAVPNKYIAMHSPPHYDGPNRNIEQHREDFFNLCDQYAIEAVFIGHEHNDKVWDRNGMDIPWNSSYDDTLYIRTNDGRFDGAYRLITLVNDKIVTYSDEISPGVYDSEKSLVVGKLNVLYHQPNDGTFNLMNATLTK